MIRADFKFNSQLLLAPVEVKAALPYSLIEMAPPQGRGWRTLWLFHCAFADAGIFFESLGASALCDKYSLALIAPSLPNSFFRDQGPRRNAAFVGGELIPALQQLLPLSKAREDNAAFGISMGAYGALCLALEQPQLFGRVFAVSGYYEPALPDDPRLDKERRQKNILKIARPWLNDLHGGPQGERNAVATLTEQAAARGISLLPQLDFSCGSEDYLSQCQTEYVRTLLEHAGIASSFALLPEEGHDEECWSKALRQCAADFGSAAL